MPTLLFRLQGVDAEEAQEVRQLLEDHALEFFETSAGWWGTGVAAIWLLADTEAARARELLDDYQSERVAQARRRSGSGSEGANDSVWRRILEQPLYFSSVVIAVVLILALSIWPFVTMLDD